MIKVWVIKNNGSYDEQEFPNNEEAINYAKDASMRALCAFRSEGDKMVTYEYGEIVKGSRARDLAITVDEIFNRENEHYAKQGRGKAIKRKV